MKKTFVAVALFLFALGSVAMAQRQEGPQRIWNQMLNHSRGEQWVEAIKPSTVVVEAGEGDAQSSRRYLYTYDENEYYLNTREIQVQAANGAWSTDLIENYDYDFHGNMASMVVIDADENYVSRETRSYADQMLSDVVYQDWDGTGWANVKKEEYTYPSETKIQILIKEWSGSNWSTTEMYTITQNGNSMELLMQYMQGGAWQNSKLEVATMNELGNPTEVVSKIWKGNNWMNEKLRNYSYFGDLFNHVYESQWDEEQWKESFRYDYEYDGQGNAIMGECFLKNGANWVHCNGQLEMSYQHNEFVEEFDGWMFQAIYIDVTSVEEGLESLDFTFYPNPVKDVLVIRSDDFQKAEIYSLTGSKLSETTSNRVDVKGLRPGMYLLRIYGFGSRSDARVFVVK